MKKELVEIVEKILDKTQKIGFLLINEKEINYGVQLTFFKNNVEIKLNIYHSEKKGYSMVFGQSKDSPEKQMLQSVINYAKAPSVKPEHSHNLWLGTDESGKGDFFGALCTAGFVSDKKIARELIQKGITDSKKLSDKQIVTYAEFIYKRYKNNIATIVLMPAKYNELYQKFVLQKKKLNQLLAWMHGRIIVDLHKKHNFDAAIVDKFADKRVITSSLKELNNIKIITRVRAESDPAVAAASIIARYHFLRSLKILKNKFNITFPKGASNIVVATAKDFSKKFGKSELNEVAKIHFKTYDKI